MANRPAKITQAELTRVAKAMRAGGVDEWRVDIRPDGTVSILAGMADDVGTENPSALQEWRAKRAAAS